MKKTVHKKNRKHRKKTIRKINKISHKYYGGETKTEIMRDNLNFRMNYANNLRKIEEAIKLNSGKHAIDEEAAQLFINKQLNEVRKQAARDLVENTTYITLEEVSQITEELIKKTYAEYNLNDAEQIYCYCGPPNKSFYIMAVLALKYIRELNKSNNSYKEPIFVSNLSVEYLKIIGQNPIIILDDISYSGAQMSNWFEALHNHCLGRNKFYPNIHLLLIALNNLAKAYLSQYYDFNGSRMKSKFKIVYLENRLYTNLIGKLRFQRYFNMIIFFSFFVTPFISMYVDHKIASEASTFTKALTYGPIVPSNYNWREAWRMVEMDNFHRVFRGFMEEKNIKEAYDTLDKEDIIEDENIQPFIDFHPFLSSCNASRDLINIITDPEIKRLDYSLFLLPTDCLNQYLDPYNELGKQYECVAYTGAVFDFIRKKNINHDLVPIIDKINSIKCPKSWYKKGELAML